MARIKKLISQSGSLLLLVAIEVSVFLGSAFLSWEVFQYLF